MTGKLDEQGLVPFPGYDQIGSGKQTSWLRATREERDALLELFKDWVDELSLQPETGFEMTEGVITGLKRRIAELKAAKGG